MTNDKINELMAVEVMGWTIVKESKPDKTQELFYDKGYRGNGLLEQFCNFVRVRLFKPTTSMNQAMECVASMICDGWTIEMRLSAEDGIGFSVLIRKRSLLYRIPMVHLNELPLAICLAILKAKGIKYDQ